MIQRQMHVLIVHWACTRKDRIMTIVPNVKTTDLTQLQFIQAHQARPPIVVRTNAVKHENLAMLKFSFLTILFVARCFTVSKLRILATLEAKMSNLWTFGPITLIIDHLSKICMTLF